MITTFIRFIAQRCSFHRKYEITFYRKYEITGIFINWVLATDFMLATFISHCKLCLSLCSFTALSLFLLFTDLYVSDSIFFFWIILFFLLTLDLHLELECQSYLCSARGSKVRDSSSSPPLRVLGRAAGASRGRRAALPGGPAVTQRHAKPALSLFLYTCTSKWVPRTRLRNPASRQHPGNHTASPRCNGTTPFPKHVLILITLILQVNSNPNAAFCVMKVKGFSGFMF